MRIDSTAGQIPQTPTPDAAPRRPNGTAESPDTAIPTEVRRDSVEISSNARALAFDQAASAERVAIARARVASGFYNTPAVLDAVAERLLASGDL